jgi:hypothetical protein
VSELLEARPHVTLNLVGQAVGQAFCRGPQRRQVWAVRFDIGGRGAAHYARQFKCALNQRMGLARRQGAKRLEAPGAHARQCVLPVKAVRVVGELTRPLP